MDSKKYFAHIIFLSLLSALLSLIALPFRDSLDWVTRWSVVLASVSGLSVAVKSVRNLPWNEKSLAEMNLTHFGVLTFFTFLLYRSTVVVREKTTLDQIVFAGVMVALMAFVFFAVLRVTLHVMHTQKSSITDALRVELRESRQTLAPFALAVVVSLFPSVYYATQIPGIHWSFFAAQLVVTPILIGGWMYFAPILKDGFID